MSHPSFSRRSPAAVAAVLLAAMTAGWQAQRCHAESGADEVIDLLAGRPAASLRFLRHDQDPLKPAATVHADGRELVMPFGSGVAYELAIPPFAELVAEKIRPRGTATARLEVWWQPDGGEERLLTPDMEALPEPRVRIGNTTTQKGRLVLQAIAARIVDPSIASLTVVGPRVGAGTSPASLQPVPPAGIVQRAPNVILFVIDALRADHVGCYGSLRGATPSIDRFASEAVIFDNAQAQAPLTNPAVASMFTGLWPQRHQVLDLAYKLRSEAETLAEVVHSAGAATAAVIANGNLCSDFGFAQGFESFEYVRDVRSDDFHARASDINEAILDWLDRRPARPFFLYVHTLGPHAPYLPQEPYRSRFAGGVSDLTLGTRSWQKQIERSEQAVNAATIAGVTALYDAEVAENDAAFGRLVLELQRRGILDETVIIVTADHGEELFDHGGFGHGSTLHAEVLEIPLVIRFPHRRRSGRVDAVVEQVDLMPTVLQIFGAACPNPIQGQSLLPVCGGQRHASWKNRAVSYLRHDGRIAVSLLGPRWKLIVGVDGDDLVPAVFDRRADPREQHDLAAERRGQVERLESRLRRISEDAPGGLVGRPTPVELEPEREEQLRALGYL